MPVRLLRATLRTSERWHRAKYFDRCLYISLLNLVDDYGRYEGNPTLLASECFPYGDENGLPMTATAIDGGLRSLASKDLLIVYRKDGKQFIGLTRWDERKRSKPKFPGPYENGVEILWKYEECQQLRATDSSCQQVLASTPSPSPSPVPPIPPLKGGSTVVPVQRFLKPSLEQVRLFCTKAGISMADADWFWNKMEGCGWRNGGKPVVSWEKTLTAWKLAGYLASMRQNRNGQPSPAKQMTVAERAAERMARELGL